MRIISLIASSTEIVCALGMEEFLVGRSHECDYPSSVQRLPVCAAPKFRVAASSLEIDRQVKEILEQASSVYFNRPGPRLAESLEILAEIFHSEVFSFGHKEAGWQRL